MKTIMDYLGDPTQLVALSTVRDGRPSVRFFSFKMFVDGKLYFLTSTKKGIYQELLQNNHIEICSIPTEDMEWVRVQGNVKFLTDKKLLKKAFSMLDLLTKAFGSPDNPDLVLLEITNAEAKKFSMLGGEETLPFA